MVDKTKIGVFIAQLRKKKNLTGEAFAERLDVSPQAVSKWENGRCLPETALLPKISEVLGISIDVLLNPCEDCDDITGRAKTASETELENRVRLIDQLNGQWSDGGAPYGLDEPIQIWNSMSQEAKLSVLKFSKETERNLSNGEGCSDCRYADTLCDIITEFADSGWSKIDKAAKAWLSDCKSVKNKETLIQAITDADKECGNCGCEYDALYKTALNYLREPAQ